MTDHTGIVVIEFLGGPQDGDRRQVTMVPEAVSVPLQHGTRGVYTLDRADLERGRDGRTLTRYLRWQGVTE